MNHWGSDQGITVLKQLSQLYMLLIWETIVLEAISKSETSPEETKLVEKDLEMLKVSTSTGQEEPSGEDCPVKVKKKNSSITTIMLVRNFEFNP